MDQSAHFRELISGKPLLLSQHEAAKMIGVDYDHFRELVDSGEIPYKQVKKRKKILPEDLEAWRQQGKVFEKCQNPSLEKGQTVRTGKHISLSKSQTDHPSGFDEARALLKKKRQKR